MKHAGGGFGFLTRKYGLASDNVLEVQAVLADGSLVTANAGTRADLLWACRVSLHGRRCKQTRRCCPLGDRDTRGRGAHETHPAGQKKKEKKVEKKVGRTCQA